MNPLPFRSRTYHPVFPGIGIADIGSSSDLGSVERHGYTAILNVDREDFGGVVNHRIVYEWRPLPNAEPSDYLDAIESLRSLRGQGHRVIVCCTAGVTYSPAVVAAYMIRYRMEALQRHLEIRHRFPASAEFEYFHGFVNCPRSARGAGISPALLEDSTFLLILETYRAMSCVRHHVYMDPEIWLPLLPVYSEYLAEAREHSSSDAHPMLTAGKG